MSPLTFFINPSLSFSKSGIHELLGNNYYQVDGNLKKKSQKKKMKIKKKQRYICQLKKQIIKKVIDIQKVSENLSGYF